MKVRVVSYSQEPTPDAGTPLDLVAYCARVSNPANQNNKKTAKKLVDYLIKHKHWSPLEMVNVCMEIETTRDIARQLLRHRSFSFQEFSQRYADPTEDLDFEIREARLQDPTNRQNSIICEDAVLEDSWANKQLAVIETANLAYKWAIENGIAKEQARAVLPEGLTLSRLYVNGTMRSWIHYIELRSENGTQLEHITLAKECAKVITEIFPYDFT
jgi:thymidylate synthase (FAD)|tara:strand:+ start:652 stop:1296 length:645 start_codon:yes stop_codon:yes gene_type:complete